MIQTDSHASGLGTRDFVFSCHNRAFAATWSPLLPKPTETLIDLELTEFLDIPIRKIEARKFSYAGTNTRIVGHISQTIQCVVNGKTSGTIHLKASVVRHLTKLFNMDCVAGGQMYKRLADATPNSGLDTISSPEHKVKLLNASPDKSSTSSNTNCPKTPKRKTLHSIQSSPTSSIYSSPGTPIRSSLHNAWLYQNGVDDRYDVEIDQPVDNRWVYDEEYEMWGLPYNLSGPLAKPDIKDSMVTYIMDTEDNMVSFMSVVEQDWPKVGQTFPPTIPIPNSDPTLPPLPPTDHPNISSIELNESPATKPEPTQPQPALNPTKHIYPDKILLRDLVFCGHHQPCPCLPKFSQQQASLLPPHLPIYLPQDHKPCGLHCGCHHVHQAGTCHCEPPSINQYLDPPDWFWETFPARSSSISLARPSIQNVTVTDPTAPVSSASPDVCAYCDRVDDQCRCEDLYFRLQEEQRHPTDM